VELPGGGRVRLRLPIRVAAIGITPPGAKASGGISAGIQLMRCIAERCDTAMYVMADRDEDLIDGRLKISLRRAANALLPLRRWVPRAVITMAWRADIESWLKEFSPDLVHLHNPHPVGALRAAARTCSRLRIPYVISTHGFVEFNDFALGYGTPRWQRPLLKRLLRDPLVEVACGAARVMMLSPFEEAVLTGMGVAKDHLRLVTNGVDPYFLETVSLTECQRLTARFGLPADRPLLLFVGNHTANKGLDILLRALTAMRESCVALIAGAIRSKAETERLVGSCGLHQADPRVKFTDFLTKEELRALYRSVDLFVFPSRADTLPLVILEAMASSLPVVASKVGGVPFEVTDQTGILVEPGNAQGLAVALDQLCRSAETRRLMGEAGRKRVLDHFSWRSAASAAIAVYEEILSLKAQPRPL
jgi:starch synthase